MAKHDGPCGQITAIQQGDHRVEYLFQITAERMPH